MNEGERKANFFALMERYCELGRLLPTEADLNTDDAVAVAEAKVVLAEMNKTKSEMEVLLELEGRRRQ
jgi:hypothetical protein